MNKIIALGVLLFVTGIVCLCNMSNEKVDGGYAAYVYSNPVWGCKEFKQVINGPGGTGMVWRQDSIVVCVTPYTMMESFDDIRAADQLKMNAEAHLVWRIDPTKIKEFVEQYGAISEVEHTPEAIATDAYDSFVKQPFRTAVRTSIAEYRGLDAPANIPAITNKVETILRQHFEGTPFIIESVTIGHTIPPESVTAGITRKVEASQEYERQAIQLEIARRNEEIQLAEGRAQANRVREEAQGALDMTGAVGTKVTFINPTVGTKIAAKALGAFNNPDIAKDLYRENWLGKYGASTIVTESYMPVIVADSSRTATVSLTAVTTDGEIVGFEPIVRVTGTAKAGDVFKVDGLKMVDKNGVQVDTDYTIIVGENGSIPELRIEIEGKSCNNANAWVAEGTDSLTLTYALEDGKKYAVTQTRIEGAVAFDSYKFADLPGTKMTTEKFEDSAIEVQCYEGGNIDTFTSGVRIVVPFAVGLPDPREAVLAYIEMN